MKASAVVGIDPGKSGGFAIIYMDDRGILTMPMPIAGKSIDIERIHAFLNDNFPLKKDFPIAYVEKVHAMPGQGVSSMFSFGFGVGVLHGVITAMRIPLYLVAPQTWKSSVLRDSKKDKDAAVEFCRRVYPDTLLFASSRSTKPHSGMADALCIAHYGYERQKDV